MLSRRLVKFNAQTVVYPGFANIPGSDDLQHDRHSADAAATLVPFLLCEGRLWKMHGSLHAW